MLSEETLAEMLTGVQGVGPLDCAREVVRLRALLTETAAQCEEVRRVNEMLVGSLGVREHELSEALAARDAAHGRLARLAALVAEVCAG